MTIREIHNVISVYQGMKLKKDAEGTGEKIAGEVQKKIGQIEKVLGT